MAFPIILACRRSSIKFIVRLLSLDVNEHFIRIEIEFGLRLLLIGLDGNLSRSLSKIHNEIENPLVHVGDLVVEYFSR